jgi:hypothetical protein
MCSGHNPDLDNSYPRSRTMSFLTQQPVLVIRLLLGLTILLMTRRQRPTRISRERAFYEVATSGILAYGQCPDGDEAYCFET